MADAVARAASVSVTDVRRAAMLVGDLRDTARLALTGGAAALATVRLRVLRARRADARRELRGRLRRAVDDRPASVEWKLDGARIQVHRHDGEVRVFTRNLNDVTDRLPEVVAAARTFPARTFVLDGEANGVGDDDRPHRFQDTMSSFGRARVDEHGIPLTAFFFDCLHVDGDDLLALALEDRLDAVTRLAGPRAIPVGAHRRRRGRRRLPRPVTRGRPRGRAGEGTRVDVRGGAARRAPGGR
ncbi:MAG: hypothetical protein KatS3mg010_1632 [Acidimicrobiia bacterium]|nr:MAG: hypothetical protein KatS3mg010_1632 [Acidimicrobiia bacterium]